MTCFGIKVNTTIGFEFWSLALVSADGLLWLSQVPMTLDFFLTCQFVHSFIHTFPLSISRGLNWSSCIVLAY